MKESNQRTSQSMFPRMFSKKNRLQILIDKVQLVKTKRKKKNREEEVRAIRKIARVITINQKIMNPILTRVETQIKQNNTKAKEEVKSSSKNTDISVILIIINK